MPKPPDPSARPPRRGTVLDFEAVRAATEAAIRDARVTQEEAARLVAERVEGRDAPPTKAAVSNAVRTAGPSVVVLQADILLALTGARLDGPLYRVA